MKYLFSLAAIFVFSAPSFAEDHFLDRVVEAKKVERSPDGRAYLMRFMPAVNHKLEIAIDKCFPDTAAGTKYEFEIVADIDSNGRISNVETLPSTDSEKCYAKSIVGIEGPAPGTGKHVPIYISTTLKH